MKWIVSYQFLIKSVCESISIQNSSSSNKYSCKWRPYDDPRASWNVNSMVLIWSKYGHFPLSIGFPTNWQYASKQRVLSSSIDEHVNIKIQI